jgi:hypothetical protein
VCDNSLDDNCNGFVDEGCGVIPGGGGGGGTISVGGTASMANKIELLVPWIALTVLMLLTVGIAASRKFRKKFEK